MLRPVHHDPYRWLSLPIALVLLACGSSGGGDPVDAADVPMDAVADAPTELPADVAPEAGDTSAQDAPPEEIELVDQQFSFRAIFGMSMGANATMIAAHHPGIFDLAGGLGGYLDYRYLAGLVRDRAFGGFCPLEQILANLDDVDDPTNPDVYCGPVKGTQPYEFDWDYNHWKYDFGPTEFTRNFYVDVFEGFMMLYGSFFSYNPDNPLLPAGVPPEWHRSTPDAEKCASPYRVGKPHNYNKEYNPLGEYDLVTFCDGDNPVGCKDGDPTKCGEDHPDYLDLAASYDPAYPHTRPVSFALAVDLNGNGRRDYAEPIVINANERWQDVGVDGCPNDREDGQGGCFADAIPHGQGVDANGDDFDLLDNPRGSEGNALYDQGEPYEDLGLDGVSQMITGAPDHGEGNGVFDYNPHFLAAIERDLHTYFAEGPIDEIKRIDWYFDGGIRDPLHHLTSNLHLLVELVDRGEPLRVYDQFGTFPDSLMPFTTCGGLMDHLGTFDWSRRGVGKNVLLRYGDPNASDDQLEAGNGKHIGDGCEIVNRGLVGYAMAAWRWPDPIVLADGDIKGRNVFSTFYSEAMGNRRWFGVTLPPGYDKPENADLRYPVAYFLTGHGMTVDSTSMTGILTSLFMGKGALPRYIMVSPDGQCCVRRRSTGERWCGCLKRESEWQCVDPTCTGPHETCAIENPPGGDLEQECNKGNFYANHRTDRWGNEDGATYMRYEDAVLELIDYVDATYRTREPAVWSLPKE